MPFARWRRSRDTAPAVDDRKEGFAKMGTGIEQYREIGRAIEAYLRPATFPLAIKLIKSESEIPAKSKRPGSDLDLRTFICQNFRMCRSYGGFQQSFEQRAIDRAGVRSSKRNRRNCSELARGTMESREIACLPSPSGILK
jgi:hypothetical protein